MVNKQAKLSEKSCRGNLSQRQFEKISADQNWLAMEISKQEFVVHAKAVDAGFADARPASYYAEMIFHPSAWHEYKHKPERPRCMLEAA